jgi:hypothetical protein
MILLAAVCALFFLASGCSKINSENYARIEAGMTYAEVVDILGPPDEIEDVLLSRSAVWGKTPKVIRVKFIADKVIYHTATGLD